MFFQKQPHLRFCLYTWKFQCKYDNFCEDGNKAENFLIEFLSHTQRTLCILDSKYIITLLINTLLTPLHQMYPIRKKCTASLTSSSLPNCCLLKASFTCLRSELGICSGIALSGQHFCKGFSCAKRSLLLVEFHKVTQHAQVISVYSASRKQVTVVDLVEFYMFRLCWLQLIHKEPLKSITFNEHFLSMQ